MRAKDEEKTAQKVTRNILNCLSQIKKNRSE